MAVWHAHLDTAGLGAGSQVSVLSDHQTVRIITADQVSIESPDGQRISALVMDRSGDHMVLGAPGGAAFELTVLRGETAAPGSVEPFSHELWRVN